MTAVVTRSGEGRRILLVDDVELNRVLASAVLGSAHYAVDCATDGPSAAIALQAGAYDLVLLNLAVPDLEPVLAASRRTNADAPKLVSLSTRQRDAVRAAATVALDDHIVRSSIPADLVRAVERVLDAPAIWRREVFADLVKHLGVTRMNDLLVDLLALSASMVDTIARADSNVEIDRRAHDLASVSGMFGFDAVSQGCFAVLRSAGGAARRQAIANLVEALRRANAMIQAAVGRGALAVAA